MGSRSAAKSSRGKAVNTSGANKTSGKSGKEKQSQNDESDEIKDLAVLRKSVGTSVNGLEEVLDIFQTGTQEVRKLLSQECKVIYECRACENLFRSIANFISHKRIYCQEGAPLPRSANGLSLQPNGAVLHNGQPARDDGSLEIVIVEPEPPIKRQRSKSPEQWICNESTPDPETIDIDNLPKLECSVPPIRRRKDICGVIEKLRKRASRQNLANATAVAAHYAELTGTPFSLTNPLAIPTSKSLFMENISDTKNAVYQTMLCKASSSMTISHPSVNSEHSKMLSLRELVGTSSKNNELTMASSLCNLPTVSDELPSFKEPLPCPKSPVPHDLLIKKRVSHLKEVTSQNEVAVMGPEGTVITTNSNGPNYPPEVFSGGLSNSEGEEVEEEEEEDAAVVPKVKSKGSVAKDSSCEEKEEIICSICKARFSTRKTLNHHMKSLHVMFRTYYRCPCCKNCFANNWSVYRHLYKVHRKTTDQVRKLRALIKKKAFRKKILIPLPASSTKPASAKPNADNSKDDLSTPSLPTVSSKVSPSSSGKQFSSSLPSSSRMPSGPGRSGSPLPPPSEATQYPAISAQYAQLLRRLENIVKEDRRHMESYPEFPGVGQSCPGCSRRFERRAALASHVHSCHKQVLLAAQKAIRAGNKQQQKKATRAGTGGKSGTASEDPDKGSQQPKEDPVKVLVLSDVKPEETEIKEEGNASGSLEESEMAETCTDKRHNDAASSKVVRSQSQNPISVKNTNEADLSLPAAVLGCSSKSSSDMQLDKSGEEEWDDMERPNSALSTGTHQDSSSPLTVASQSGKQQRIAIQIRKDYVKGDKGSVCPSWGSSIPCSASQTSKLDEEGDDKILILSSSPPKNPLDASPGSCKQSVTSTADICSDPEGSDNSHPTFNPEDKKKNILEKRELVLQLEDILGDKKSPDSDCTFQIEEDDTSEEPTVCSVEKEESGNIFFEKRHMEGMIGSHGEVKRVFLEVIVGGVADPNSLAMDEEENEKLAEEKVSEPKMEKEEFKGASSRRTTTVRSQVPSSSLALQTQRGRPVRNRVKVEREDFIYDLSDMRLSPAKREDVNSVSGSSISLKRPRRNNPQFLSNISQGAISSQLENSSSVKQLQSSSASSVGGTALRVYSGKGGTCSLSSNSQVKVPISAGGSAGSHKLSDCRVVIGGLRSGDMTQLSVRRVYGSRKLLIPSNATAVAAESEDVVSCNSLKKFGRNKECALSLNDVDEDLFGEMGQGEVLLPKKQTGKSSILYQSDSVDSTES